MNSKAKYRIALPKGALFQDAKTLFEKAGQGFEIVDRKLMFLSQSGEVEFLMVRPNDVAVFVEYGAADLGVLGSDVIGEYDPQVLTLGALNFGHCDLVVAVTGDSPFQELSKLPDYCKVGTKFPNLTKQYFNSLGIPVEIIKLYGSIEIAPLTGLSEAIVDLVGTGRTLRENGLVRIETISKHSARLISNRVSWQLNNAWMLEMLQALGLTSKPSISR